jgi:hypothetical protein
MGGIIAQAPRNKSRLRLFFRKEHLPYLNHQQRRRAGAIISASHLLG